MTTILDQAMKLADQDCPLPSLAGPALKALRARVLELESEHAFKNFHQQLCARFGYTHDEVDWRRDQVSLIEWIASRQAARVDEATIREVISDLREWGEAGDEQLLVRASRLEAALSAQPAPERLGRAYGHEFEDMAGKRHFVRGPVPTYAQSNIVPLYLHPAAPVGVPDGMVLVPSELPDRIRTVLVDRFARAVDGDVMLFTDIWSDLLAAAPSAPQVGA